MSKPHGTKDFWLTSLRDQAEAFAGAVSRDGAMPLAVPTCPGWTVDDLTKHLARVYRWVCSHVTRGVISAPERGPQPEPPEGTPAVTWWHHAYHQVSKVLEGLDPQFPAWNWAPQPKKAIFWHRRMAHETAVHRWDAQMATGPVEPIASRLAADGITEVIDTWLPAGRYQGTRRDAGVIALAAADLDQIWYVRLRDGGVALLDTDTLLDDDDHHERVVARGTASDLLLALYGRVPFDVLEVSGDAGLLDGLRTG